jgi:hypothetical protein
VPAIVQVHHHSQVLLTSQLENVAAEHNERLVLTRQSRQAGRSATATVGLSKRRFNQTDIPAGDELLANQLAGHSVKAVATLNCQPQQRLVSVGEGMRGQHKG